MGDPELLAEGATRAAPSAICDAFMRAFTPDGLKRFARGKARFRDRCAGDPFASLDREPPTTAIIAEMPNSFASFISIQLELWDRGGTWDYRVLHTGVTGPLGVAASRGEARQRAAKFKAAI